VKGRSRVVVMSSLSGGLTTPGTGAYSASKYAIESLTEPHRELYASRHPRRRYLLDSLSRAQKAFVALTPTALSDAVLAGATTSKPNPGRER
jgi:hypothetical protein